MSQPWDYGNEPQGQVFTVTGNRGGNDWNSIDPGTLALFGIFDFGAGDPMGGYPLPTMGDPATGLPRERVDQKAQPSEGQEDFDDDGNVFNDGAAPTRQTVEAWLESMADAGKIDFFWLQSDAGDGPTTYAGHYTTDEGRTFTFSSDGNGNYGQVEIGATGGSYDDFMF